MAQAAPGTERIDTMSKATFEIVGGWLRVADCRIRMSGISRYITGDNSYVCIWTGGLHRPEEFRGDGIAEALDAWFEGEGEIDQIGDDKVYTDSIGNLRKCSTGELFAKPYSESIDCL